MFANKRVVGDSPRCVAGVSECQVPCAQLVQHSQHTEARAYGMATLYYDEAGQQTRLVRYLNTWQEETTSTSTLTAHW
jgi:hypothetical protein